MTAGKTGGTGTGNLKIVNIAPTAAPVMVQRIISLITLAFHLRRCGFLLRPRP